MSVDFVNVKRLISPFVLGLLILPCRFSRADVSIALVGGSDGTEAYAAFVDPNTLTAGAPLANLPTGSGGKIKAVALNQNGLGLIGGVSTFPTTTPYAAFVALGSNTAGTVIANLPPAGNNNFINSVGINNKGIGIISGAQVSNPPPSGSAYAAFVNSMSQAAGPLIGNLNFNAEMNGASINDSNTTILGCSTALYATFVDFATNTAGSSILNLPGQIMQVAVNNANQVIVGGQASNAAYAAFVDFNTNTAGSTILNLPTTPNSCIGRNDVFIPGNGVAINDQGDVLIGGSDGNAAYAAFVNMSTNTAGSPISNLPTASGSLICGVALNPLGQGLIGGYDGTKAYAAFVDPLTNTASSPISGLPTAAGSIIYSVAFTLMRENSLLPIGGLTGNNKIFAKYINKYAPQDVFYFLPSIMQGDLPKALEITAPTRNAIAPFMADVQLFSLNQGLSTHLRNHRHFREAIFAPRSKNISDGFETSWDSPLMVSADEEWGFFDEMAEDDYEDFEEDLFIADAASPGHSSGTMPISTRPNGLWFEGIGFLASQKAQHQTVGFSPYAGGAILGWDRSASPCWRAGGGAAYMYTYVSEHQGQGHSHINQETLFAYASWGSHHFYFNGALWGGAFQIEQRRDMDLTGWHFHATSHPHGWQLSPHVEGGYEYTLQTHWFAPSGPASAFIAAPFAMIDWVNAWQHAYKEHGNGPFNAGQHAHYASFLRSEAGLRCYECFGFSRWRLLVGEAVSYVNKTPFGVGEVTGFLVGSPGSFTLETLTASDNLARIELSTQFEPEDMHYPYGSFAYYGEFSSAFSSQQVVLELAWDF